MKAIERWNKKRALIRNLDRQAASLQRWYDRLKEEQLFPEALPVLLDIQYRLSHLSNYVLKTNMKKV